MPESVTDETATSYDGGPATPATYPDTSDGNPPQDLDLAAVVAAWADLPDAVRVGIVAMVKAAGSEQ